MSTLAKDAAPRLPPLPTRRTAEDEPPNCLGVRPPAGADAVEVAKARREKLMRNLHFGSLPGSIILLGYGIKSIKEAQTPHERVNALTDTGMGAAHTLSSSTTKLALFSGIAQAGWFPLALTAASGCTALVAMLDAGRDIFEGHQSGNKESYVAAGLKFAAAGLMVAGMIATPGALALPVAGAIGYGCTCLWQQREHIKESLPVLKAKIKHLPQTLHHAASRVIDLADHIVHPSSHQPD